MLRSIATFLKDPKPTSNYSEVAVGLNVVDGIVRVKEPLRSPVRGVNCVAFFYRSFLIIPAGRATPAMPHSIKKVEAYTSFELEMEGGSISVVPGKTGKFEHKDHQELARQYGKDFQGLEETIVPGARVRLTGKVKKIDGKYSLKMKSIILLDKPAAPLGAGKDLKKKKK